MKPRYTRNSGGKEKPRKKGKSGNLKKNERKPVR